MDNKRVYMNLSDKTNLVLSMLTISKQMSGKLPDKEHFHAALKKLDIEPTDDLLEKVHKQFPTMSV